MEKILINSKSFLVDELKYHTKTNKITNNNLMTITFNISFESDSQKDDFKELISQDSLRIEIPDRELSVSTRIDTEIYFVEHPKSNTNKYLISVIGTEDKNDNKKWNSQSAIIEEIVGNWIAIQAINTLMYQKGIYDDKEFEMVYDKLSEMNLKKYCDHIIYGTEC